MNVYDIVTKNILLKLVEIDEDPIFKEKNPGILASEYLYAKVYPKIKTKRLINILNGKANRITLRELYYIAEALNIPLSELFKNV